MSEKSGKGVNISRVPASLLLVGAAILFVTGTLKLIGLFTSRSEIGPDPLFSFLTIRQLLFVSAALEIGVAFAAIFLRPIRLRACLLAWLATLFAIYRIGLWCVGYNGPCRCAGPIGNWVPGHEGTVSALIRGALFYLLLAGYGVAAYSYFKASADRSVRQSK